MNDEDVTINTQNQEGSPSANAIGCPQVVCISDDPKKRYGWYVMRSTYSREMKAREIMSGDGITCYVPTKMVRTFDGEGNSAEKEVSLVHNYIFVRTDREFMDAYKRRMETVCPIRYVMDKSTEKPMLVSDKEMEDFMRVTKEASDSIRYLDNPGELLQKGQDVEVINGPFAGVRGKIVRLRRDRRVVVNLAGFAAVAMGSMPIAWLKIGGESPAQTD